MHPRIALVGLLIACGGPASPDTPPDAAPVTDASADGPAPDAVATVCTPAAPSVPDVTVDATPGTALVLDGQGTRCEQLARALLDPTQRPAPLAAMDPAASAEPPLCIDYPEQDAVRVDVNRILGKPLYSGGQWLLAWVRKSDNVVTSLTGWYLTAPFGDPEGCAADDSLRDAVIGHKQAYTTFQLCAPLGGGTWSVAGGDVRELGPTGYFWDGKQLHAAREVEVGVAAGAVTQELLDSDLNCCGVLDDAPGCIGITLIVDADTGEVLGDRRRCLVC